MNIQIIGHNKCNNTKKAIRFFKERNISFHFKDITEKPVSRGELESIKRKISPDDLIDKEAKLYKSGGYEYLDFDPEEEILEKPLLMKTPVIRNGSDCTLGYKPDTWKEWINS